MSRRYATLVTAGLLVVALGCVAFLLPVPYVAMKPGPTFDTLGKYQNKPIITFGDSVKTYPTSGSLSMTTVSVTSANSHLSLAEAFAAYFDSTDAVVPRDLIYPDGESAKRAVQQTSAQMTGSKQTSEAAALRLAGYDVSRAASVVRVAADGSATGILKPGDRIVTVDGTKINAPKDAVKAITSLTPGAKVKIGITRDDRHRTVTVKTGPSPDDKTKARIGITLGAFHFPITVTNNVGEQIGGPSAGTMFALAIYDKLTPGELTKNLAVAGTGEITGKGKVLPIGGIQQKIAGAAAAGATVFLVPAKNCAEARDGDDFKMKLVKIKNLKQAVASLESIVAGQDAKVALCN